MTTIHEIQQQLIDALKAEQDALTNDDRAIDEYRALFDPIEAKFRAENPELMARMALTLEARLQTKARVKELETQARDMLTGAKIDDLPAGFEQTRDKQISITDAKTLHTWVQANMPAFLVVDEKALLKTVTGALVEDKKAGTFAIPANFAAAPIQFTLSYKPKISLATLLKL